METSIQKLHKIKKYIFCITAHTPIEKQCNNDGNTLIHLKNNGAKFETLEKNCNGTVS